MTTDEAKQLWSDAFEAALERGDTEPEASMAADEAVEEEGK